MKGTQAMKNKNGICFGCGVLYPKSVEHQVFHSKNCGTKWTKDNNVEAECFYCGEIATQNDHPFPRKLRPRAHTSAGETLRACVGCNSLLQSNSFPLFSHRFAYIAFRLARYPYSQEDHSARITSIEKRREAFIVRVGLEIPIEELRTTRTSRIWKQWERWSTKNY